MYWYGQLTKMLDLDYHLNQITKVQLLLDLWLNCSQKCPESQQNLPGNECNKNIKFPQLSENFDSLASLLFVICVARRNHLCLQTPARALYLVKNFMNIQKNVLTHFLELLTCFLGILRGLLDYF